MPFKSPCCGAASGTMRRKNPLAQPHGNTLNNKKIDGDLVSFDRGNLIVIIMYDIPFDAKHYHQVAWDNGDFLALLNS